MLLQTSRQHRTSLPAWWTAAQHIVERSGRSWRMSWRTQRIFSHRAILRTFPSAELRACSITSGVVVLARGADRTLAHIFFKRDRRWLAAPRRRRARAEAATPI